MIFCSLSVISLARVWDARDFPVKIKSVTRKASKVLFSDALPWGFGNIPEFQCQLYRKVV